jgi:methionyl-tRNA synthetase
MEQTNPTPAVTPVVPTTVPAIKYEDFAKVELRVGTVVECRPHGNADKLLVLQVDMGGERRQICAGLRAHYQPEQLVGKQIIVVANLEPRPPSGKVIILSPAEAVAAGSLVK